MIQRTKKKKNSTTYILSSGFVLFHKKTTPLNGKTVLYKLTVCGLYGFALCFLLILTAMNKAEVLLAGSARLLVLSCAWTTRLHPKCCFLLHSGEVKSNTTKNMTSLLFQFKVLFMTSGKTFKTKVEIFCMFNRTDFRRLSL